jgi:polyhydroxybutyrate depolymerase
MRRTPSALIATAAILLAACGRDGSSETTNAPTTGATSPPTTQVVETTTAASAVDATTTTAPESFTDRPYNVFVPSGYDAATPAPLVILLHGYGASGDLQELYFKLQPEAEARGFLYVHPDGSVDLLNQQFWNGTDACCDATQAVDDSGYLTHIIDEVSAGYNVDQKRIYLVGHSNGGFMSYRMACDHADRIAAIVSLAGATWLDTTRCAPSEPVNILELHGTDDHTIQYDGGGTPVGRYPSAETTVATWSTYNGCSPETEVLGTIDFAYNIEGDETTKTAFTGCPADGAVELWTIEGGPHIPGLQETFAADIVDWLYAHPNA